MKPASAIFCFALAACNGNPHASEDAGDPAEVVSARALIAADASLPPRAEALAIAEGVEARAAKESGARAALLHVVGGALLERVYRTFGKDQDAKEAVGAYDAASKDLEVAGACDAALASATLGGDAAHDPQVTYIALYKLSRRTRDNGPCAGRVAARMTTVEAFRPPPRVLLAIDKGLEAQGLAPENATTDAAAPTAKGTFVDRVDHWPGKDAARVVIALSREAHYRVSDETAPPRVVIDIDGAGMGSSRDVRASGIVTRVRVDDASTGARVVLDLDGGTVYRRVFSLEEPYRIIVDLARRPPSTGHGRTVARVVLDPGHGGYDGGATGMAGLKEKDVTLDVAKRAAPILARAGIEAVLTRDDDRFVSLEERAARANQLGADLFVSIHCNAAESHARHGIETYVLDTTRDEIAQRVAARENGASTTATADLGTILADLRLADQATHSTRLADLLQKAALASLKPVYPDVFDGGVHYAGFYVLVGARMPAVLFETSYISNAAEEQRLASAEYKDRLADAVANAIRAYREGR